MKKVSIIVPVYNAEDYLSNCLESLINQTYQNIEVILVNDGSKDKSLEICNNYAEKDNRITVLSIEKSGVSIARNLGIESSSGDYITFVDSDDWVELNMVEFVVGKTKKSSADIIMWSFFKNFPNKERALSFLSGGNQSFSSEKDVLYLKAIDQHYGEKELNEAVSVGTTWCKLYKSEFIKHNNIKFKKGLTRAQDVIFALEAFKKADLIQYYDEQLYHYRINDTSITSGTKYISDTKTPFNALLKEMIDFSNQFTNNEKLTDAINARTVRVLLWHLDHKYFHRNYKVNLFKRRKEIVKLIDSEPYKSALENINVDDLLSKKQKTVTKFFKHKLIITFYLIYKAHQKYVGFKSEK